MEAETPYKLRAYVQDDIPFIQSSWGSSYYGGISYRQLISPDEFHHFHRPIRDRFFQRPDATVIVCCATNDPKLIMAWMAAECPPGTDMVVIHYLYTKEAFKGEGLARALLGAVMKLVDVGTDRHVFYTHSTEKLERILKRSQNKYENLRFAPHLC